MPNSAVLTSEEKNDPVLIVDKLGILGGLIAQEISKELLVILVGREKSNSTNTIQIPYGKKFPVIPDNTYSFIIIVEDSHLETQKSIQAFIKKSARDGARLVYLARLSEASQLQSQKIIDSYKNSKAILFGDIFGLETDAYKNSVSSMIRQVLKDGKIKLLGDGVSRVRPVFVDDLIKGIIKATFIEGKEKICFVFPKNPITLISLAHIFQRRNPSLSVDFISGKVEPEVSLSIHGEYLLEEAKIEEQLKKIEDRGPELMGDEDKSHHGKVKSQRARSWEILYILSFACFILFIPIISVCFFLGLGYIQADAAGRSINQGKLPQAVEEIKRASFFINNAKLSTDVLRKFPIVGGIPQAKDFFNRIESYDKLSDAATSFLESYQSVKDTLEGEAKDPSEAALLTASAYKKSSIILSEALLSNKLDSAMLKRIEEIKKITEIPDSLVNNFYSLLYPKGKRSYLVLFQNNMELRPGGGFIGSYGMLTLDKGRFVDFTIHDVYDADGQLKGHVEPPYPIRRYLPSAHLYLRDSNFNPDFIKSASSAALLLSLETGQKVDGVIGVDVSFVRELIGALGQVYVPEYKETVDKNNFFQITESHVEKNFFPSSTQKKDFLGALFNSLKTSLSEKKELHVQDIVKVISKSISEKHILFAFSEPKVQGIFMANNWSGSLTDTRGKETFNDSLGISEANLGVNKANFFVGRSLKYSAALKEDGLIQSSAQISIKNSSEHWPGGDYKTYIRLISPQGSNITSVDIDGIEQRLIGAVTDPAVYEAKNFRPPDGLEIESYSDNGKSIYGLLTIIPAGKSKTITFNYSLPQKLSLERVSMYSLALIKQQGTESYPFDFIFTYPSEYSVSSKKEKLNQQKDKSIISNTLAGDKTIVLDVVRK